MSNTREKLLKSLRVDINSKSYIDNTNKKISSGSSNNGGVSENKGVPMNISDSLNDR